MRKSIHNGVGQRLLLLLIYFLISADVSNYFKGRSDFQQGLVTPVTILMDQALSADGYVGLSPLCLHALFKKSPRVILYPQPSSQHRAL